MSKEVVTPGYEWFELSRGEMLDGAERAEPINLQEEYPVDDRELLQQTWDNKVVETIDAPNGTRITRTTFNPNAEEGSILWRPGWGVTNLAGGGASVATGMAALNSNRSVIALEELENVPAEHKARAVAGDISLYADNYMFAFGQGENYPYVLSGHSLGGITLAHLATRPELEDLETINLMDMPRARGYDTAVGFALRVGLLDNRVQQKYKHLSSQEEEDLLRDVTTDEIEKNGGPLEALGKAAKQWWIVQNLAQAGLYGLLENMIEAQPDAEKFLWHGTKNVGAPVQAMRKVVYNVTSGFWVEDQEKVHYLESPTGHYSEGHTARYGRQTAYAIDHTPQN